jgi:hypothetical protein
MTIHQRQVHPQFEEGCFMCKVSTVQLSAGAANSNPEYHANENREKRWNRDMPAYKRLRDQGYQPAHIDGSADLERDATTRFEIESGQIHKGKEKAVTEAVQFVEDLTGKSVFAPVTTPKEPAKETTP